MILLQAFLSIFLHLWSHHAPHLCVPHPDPPEVSQSPIPMASEAFWNPDLIFLSQGFPFFGSFNITWGAVFGHVSVFCFCFCFLRLSVIYVCFSTFCDLYTYISPWNSGKNKLAVAQRRIQTLFWNVLERFCGGDAPKSRSGPSAKTWAERFKPWLFDCSGLPGGL